MSAQPRILGWPFGPGSVQAMLAEIGFRKRRLASSSRFHEFITAKKASSFRRHSIRRVELRRDLIVEAEGIPIARPI